MRPRHYRYRARVFSIMPIPGRVFRGADQLPLSAPLHETATLRVVADAGKLPNVTKYEPVYKFTEQLNGNLEPLNFFDAGHMTYFRSANFIFVVGISKYCYQHSKG